MISLETGSHCPSPPSALLHAGISLCRFFTAAVWCAPALRVPLVHSLINHFRQKSRRYPGKLELRAPQGATPVTLRMQALTAARFDDILAHVSFARTGSKDSRLYPLCTWDQTRIWETRGISHPQPGSLRASPNNPTAANGPGGRSGVLFLYTQGVRAFRPPRVVFAHACLF